MHTTRMKPQAVLVVALILLSCCAASGLWLATQKNRASGWVRHSFEVKEQLSKVRVSLLRAEVYRRSYLLDDARAGSTLAAISRELPRQLATLRYMTADNPAQRDFAAALERVATARLAEVAETIKLQDNNQGAEAAMVMGSARSHRTTAAIIRLIDRGAAEEQRLLARRLKEAEEFDQPILGALIFSALLVMLLGLLVHRERRERVLALGTANEQLQADIARREAAESELALLAANATDAVLRISLDGLCIYASPSVEQVLGFDRNLLLGRPLGTSVHPDDREEMLAFHHLLTSGKIERGVRTYRALHATDPGREIWIEAHSGLVRDTVTAEPCEIIASLRDVSGRKQLELQLESALDRAKTAVRAKSSFLANMSHEIRTPMNGVLGFADLLLNGDLPPSQRHQVQLIADSGKAMMRLLNDILDLSKIEAGQMEVSPEPIDVRHAMRNCIKLIQPAALQKGLQLHVEVDDALPVWVLLDGLRLRQITLNLLANAVKFTPAGHVRLHARVVEGSADAMFELTVEDTGIGIPQDRQAAVFEQFTQAEHSTVKQFGGTGLGLSISNQLASLMGGTLDLTSEEGVGTTFRLRLPLIEASPDKAALPVTSAKGTAITHLRVLLAEDHDVNQALMSAMLSRLGHQCVVVSDGLQAVDAATEADSLPDAKFDLVLMDMQMPVMDGLEATRRIRAAGITATQLPILALTANAYADDIAACLEAGMQAHLAKPVELAKLAAVIQQWGSVSAPQVIAAPGFAISPALQARFEARTAELAAFATALAASEQVGNEQIEQLADMLHKLAGSAGMFDRQALGARAAELEEQLEAAVPSSRGGVVRAIVQALEKAA
jgi:PAS domain S-box-containing protein